MRRQVGDGDICDDCRLDGRRPQRNRRHAISTKNAAAHQASVPADREREIKKIKASEGGFGALNRLAIGAISGALYAMDQHRHAFRPVF